MSESSNNLLAELSHSEIRELEEFLENADDAMDLSTLDGYAHAVVSSPKPVPPQVWLREIGEDGDGIAFDSQEQANRIIGLVLRWYNRVARNLALGHCEPVFLKDKPQHVLSEASPWCIGYVHGIALCERYWRPLMRADAGRLMLSPMFGLALPPDDDELRDLTTDDVRGMAGEVPTSVVLIYQYWRMPPSIRKQMLGMVRIPAELRRRQAVPDDSIHRLKIAIRDLKPAIWRSVEVPSATKLPMLSRILLAAMGWSDSHLHEFVADGIHYGTDDRDFPRGVRSERSRTLWDIAPMKGDRFEFHYDFGDGWRHRVTVERVAQRESLAVYPRCIAGARACPPEDCGGPPGYAELVAALADPQHPEHENLSSWIGGPFDPNEFDLVSVNARMNAPRRRKQA